MIADGGYVVQGYGWRYYLNTFCGILALLLRLSQPYVEVGLAYQTWAGTTGYMCNCPSRKVSL